MSKLYGPNHRVLQDRFDTRKLADGVERRVVETAVSADHMLYTLVVTMLVRCLDATAAVQLANPAQ